MGAASRGKPRIGLVLGAGGVIGGAWLAGGLAALEEETGWDASGADRIVGTSAGALMGAQLAAGVPPWRADTGRAASPALADRAVEAPPADAGTADEPEDTAEGLGFRVHRALPRIGPASPRLAFNALRNRDERAVAALVAGLMPQGIVSIDTIRDLVRESVPSGWADHDGLRIVACDYRTGERTAFGADDAPRADLADAVAASCAIPSFYRPVRIAGHRYVDGGLWSTSNLDLLADEGLDLVIAMNPTSSLEEPSSKGVTDRLAALMRATSGRRLGSEAKRLRASGTEVVLVQPTTEDLDVMPPNMMSRARRREVYETARRTVGAGLRADGTAARIRTLTAARPPRPTSARRARAVGAG